MTNFQETLIIATISALVAGLIVFFIQLIISKNFERKQKKEKNKVGKKTDKYIDEDFILNYLPSQIDIEKVFEDFGKPLQKTDTTVEIKWNNSTQEITIYEYKFKNAVILFSTFKNESAVISLTINSNYNKAHPVKFSFAFEEKTVYFGKAKINNEIVANRTNYISESYVNWAYSAIQSKYFYREIKHFTFTYIVCDFINSENEMMGKVIDQLCISCNEDVCPVIYFYDMI